MVLALEKSRKKTKLVSVDQEFIDALLQHYPRKPFFVVLEIIQKMPERARESFLATRAEVVACVMELRAKNEAILEQYHAKGYAEVEIEVGEEEDKGDGLVGVCRL